MVQKKVKISSKPLTTLSRELDNWVNGNPISKKVVDNKEYTRLTVIIPKSIHKKIKFKATEDDLLISDLVTSILNKYFE